MGSWALAPEMEVNGRGWSGASEYSITCKSTFHHGMHTQDIILILLLYRALFAHVLCKMGLVIMPKRLVLTAIYLHLWGR